MINKSNKLIRLAAIILCMVMVFSVAACDSSSEPSDVILVGDETLENGVEIQNGILPNGEKVVLQYSSGKLTLGTNDDSVETKQVVVLAMNAVAGVRITEQRVKLADVPITDLPIDPITSLDEVVGKYILVDGKIGDPVSKSELSEVNPMISDNAVGDDYVLFSDVVTANTNIKDTSTLIQKAIDENPGRTIYFPDGRYNLTKTVVIPSDPAKSVSFRSSNYAVFAAADSWDQNCTALFQYGTAESSKTQSGDHSDYFMGGVIDGDRKLTAIEVYGGGRFFINNVSIKNAKIGVHIKSNGAHNVIENVNVTSPTNNSKGIFVEGTNNTFTNMRIYHSTIGAHLTGGENVLVNIHPLGNPSNSLSSAGFYDQSTGNRYSVCYSDQYPVGFKMESQTKSYYDSCFMYWWQESRNQIGFLCLGEFNSIISDTTVSMAKVNSDTNSHYLYFMNSSSGGYEESSQLIPGTVSGNGIIINPIIDSANNSDSNTYQQFVYKLN